MIIILAIATFIAGFIAGTGIKMAIPIAVLKLMKAYNEAYNNLFYDWVELVKENNQLHNERDTAIHSETLSAN
jgi:hypothetical protein